jgi:hypothetical protein
MSEPMSRDAELAERYLAEVGKEPARLPDDHPDVWQWAYRGSKAEREEMIENFGLGELEPGAIIVGQEEMF